MRNPRIAAWLLGVGLCWLVIGCGGGSSSAPPGPDTNGPKGPTGGGEPGNSPLSPELAKGRAVFDKLDCGKCHMIHGKAVKGMKGMGGPDLGTVGAKPDHNAAWIAEHIKNPTVHTPMSRMPKYEGKIGDDDLKEVSKYLESLK